MHGCDIHVTTAYAATLHHIAVRRRSREGRPDAHGVQAPSPTRVVGRWHRSAVQPTTGSTGGARCPRGSGRGGPPTDRRPARSSSPSAPDGWCTLARHQSTPRLPATFASWRRSARAAPPAPAAECCRSPPSRSRPCSPRRRNRRPPAHDASVRERCGVCMADTWSAPAARHQSCSRRAPWPRAEGSSG